MDFPEGVHLGATAGLAAESIERSETVASCTKYVCQNCKEAIGAWSDGNPYFIDDNGKKKYAYHPRHDLLDRCIGNDSPHLSLACGNKFKVDSREPITKCRKCRSTEIADVCDQDGRTCPFCKQGVFAEEFNDNWHVIS